MEGRPAGAWRLLQGPGAPVAGLPIGFRFRPTDEELLLHYLRRKALACPLPAGIIHDADLARLHPRDLLPPPPGADAGGERFFFHRAATRCWRRGGGAARAAAGGAGVWRPSGKETLVVSPRCNKRPVGTKRTLVFCARGGARTDWAMHEYRLLPAALHPHGGCVVAADPHPPPPNVVGGGGAVSDWVVCRVFKRARPAHRARSGDGEDDEAGEESPSSPLSCVTEASDAGDRADGDQEEESSGASN